MTIKELMENIDFDYFDKNDMTKKNIYGHVDDTDNSEYINSIKTVEIQDHIFYKWERK